MRENRSMAGGPGKDLSRWKLSLFILCMLLGLWAGSVTASAAADLCEGVSAVSKNQVIYMGKTTDSAAFDGMTAGNAIPWLVVNKNQANNQNPSGMYLVSRDLLGKNQSGGGLSFRNDGDNSTDWMGSNARAWCQDFYKGAMTPSEQNAVLKTSLSDGGEYHTIDWNFQFDPMTLSGEEIFFLSAEEAEIFFYPSSERAARYNGQEAVWLLRSPKKSSRPKGVSAVGAVYKDGKTVLASVYRVNLDIDTSQLPEEIKNNVRMIQDLTRGDFAARPAFNLDKTKVLFSSAAKGGNETRRDRPDRECSLKHRPVEADTAGRIVKPESGKCIPEGESPVNTVFRCLHRQQQVCFRNCQKRGRKDYLLWKTGGCIQWNDPGGYVLS